MKELLDKLSSYNIFNYLLPGALFAFGLHWFGGIQISGGNIVIDAFFYYFVGMTVSRVGSLFIEPVCLWTGLVKYSSYAEYVKAATDDDRIAILLEQNNQYRTIIALIFCLTFVLGARAIANLFEISDLVQGIALSIIIIALYIFAYRKQTEYIRKRIEVLSDRGQREGRK